MTTDLTLTEARAERDALANRVDVLEKVGVLRTLPDDLHVTTDMVAVFYEVPVKTIQTVVLRNRDELDGDGLRVVSKSDLELTFNMKVGRASSFMLYPRRAVLRIGMLLRDSDPARKVRDYLLGAEARDRNAETRVIPATYAAALRELADEVDAHDLTRERALKAETTVEIEQRHRRAIEAGDGIHLTDFGKKYFSEVPARKFDDHLYAHDWLIYQRNSRTRADGEVRDGYDHRKPTAKGRPYIYDHDQGVRGGRRRFQPRVRPQMEIALRDALAAEGLPVNKHSTGLVSIAAEEMPQLEMFSESR